MITVGNYRTGTNTVTFVIELFAAFKKPPMTLKTFSGRRI
jgi:hypothetical protein